ncbi:MAG TPA: YkvA family protein [Burkholderiaceae bacterium]|nr:YkvA family protein [Burkholderiaceae bacterium]HMX10233.1 YkvA family protein [Burkholderiaceae bacterium]HMZ00547.1 YkvA family protein [Burkholderiaceae bacterium]HNG79107.1 YkvA family protein [Burkholderiaceae bacterium]
MWKRLVRLWTVVRGDARVLWFALQHPQAPTWLKAGCLAIVVYLLSPVDLIPDVIPLFGLVDDLVLVPLAMRWLLRLLPAHIRDAAQTRARGGRGADQPRHPIIDVTPRSR